MYVSGLSVKDFRSHERAELSLEPGVTVLQGPVGAGKTNLLEALYFGCVGRSFRTSTDRELIRFGAPAARVRVSLRDGSLEHALEVAIERGGQKLARVDGARVARLVDTEVRPLACVFAPDRLELVKGAAGARRAHLDEVTGALWPARRDTRRLYARALAQRNSLLARGRATRTAPSSLAGWTRELAGHGIRLMEDRRAAVELLSGRFAERAAELGLEGEATVAYRPRSDASTPEELIAELDESLAADLERGFTMHGPHRDELVLKLDARELRRYGSQGQQRLGLLALLLAERDALAANRDALPLLLLDDVLSELDAPRRQALLASLEQDGQTLITTADPQAASPGLRLRSISLDPAGGVLREEEAPA